MIVGNGLISEAFRRVQIGNGILIVASGVSNSLNASVDDYDRERIFLSEITKRHRNDLIVYFSSCGVTHEALCEFPYYKHKLEMENLISMSPRWLILRLPQVIGRSNNKNTIINSFVDDLLNGKTTALQQNATRYFIDVDHMARIVSRILNSGFVNRVFTVANPFKYSAIEIYEAVKKVLSIDKSNYEIVLGGQDYHVFVDDEVISAAAFPDLDFCVEYLDYALQKHYG